MNRPDYHAIIAEGWGETPPEWVVALADACTMSSQGKVASQIRYSAPVVSAVLRNSYAGTTDAVEQAVRGAFMNGTVPCPELGTIPGHDCIEHRRRSASFVNTNPLRVRMYRACRNCPLNAPGAKS